MTLPEPLYSLIIRNRTPCVKAGGTLEVEVFLSGCGIPERNKLIVQWSSPYVIDKDSPGSFTGNVVLATDKVTGKQQIGTGKTYSKSVNMDPIGATIILNQGYFWENPRLPSDPKALRAVIGEWEWDGEPPLLLKLNTSKKARPGDYDITFTFTYGDAQNLAQDYKTTGFHVSSWWERNELWLAILAILIALASLIATAVGTFTRGTPPP